MSTARFPHTLISSFGTESSDIVLGDEIENQVFNSIFRVEQHIDQLDAYLYVEQNWLTKDIYCLQAEDFITLAKEINTRAGRALMHIKDEAGHAGEYARIPISVNNTTTIPDVEFQKSLTFSMHNYNILLEVYGQEVAEDYKIFVLMIEAEFKSAQFTEGSLQSSIAMCEIVENYANTPGAIAFNKVLRIIYPASITKKMRHFAETLVQNLKDGASPIECAGFALASLAGIHPFSHANSRTARILQNTVLMMMGHPCINIPVTLVNDYYLALGKSLAEDKTPIINLLSDCHAQSQPSDHTFSLEEAYYPLYCPMPNEDESDLLLECQADRFVFIKKQIGKDKFLTSDVIDADFYFQHAEAMLSVNPTVAKFYYYSSLRMSKGSLQDITLEKQLPPAGIFPVIKLPVPAVLKTVHSIAPHETGRLSAEHAKTKALFTKLMGDRFAIIIKDKKGNISLTCIDRASSLAVIAREVTAMQLQVGEFTIDVVKTTNESDVESKAKKMIQSIQKTFPGVLNSKGNLEPRSSKNGCVLIQYHEKAQDYKLFTPESDDLMARTPYVLMLRRYGLLNIKAPIFKDWKTFQGSKSKQARLSERMITRQMDPDYESLPTLVFNNEWTGDYPESSKKIRKFLNRVYLITDIENIKQLINTNANYVGHAKLKDMFVDNLLGHIKHYQSVRANSLYHSLQSFFSKPDPVLPANAIGHIAAYGESEDLLDIRTSVARLN